MTQAINHGDPAVAALQESVRHNEKNIDKLDRDLKDFRAEVLKQFEKVDQRFEKIDQRFGKVDNRFTQLEAQVNQCFDKVDQRLDKTNDRFNQLETKVNDRFNQITMLLVAIVGLVVALLVKLVVFD